MTNDVEVATQAKLLRLEEALDRFFADWEKTRSQGGWTFGHLVARLKEEVRP